MSLRAIILNIASANGSYIDTRKVKRVKRREMTNVERVIEEHTCRRFVFLPPLLAVVFHDFYAAAVVMHCSE